MIICPHCNKPVEKTNPRANNLKMHRECRSKYYYYKHNHREWQENYRQKHMPEDAIACLICGKKYVQVGSHVWYKHGMSAQEYKEEFDLPTSYGIAPKRYRDMKGEIAIENETYKNLVKGKHQRYKPGDPKAKEVNGWKGRRGSLGFTGY